MEKMKYRFAKLLLGEDISRSGKGAGLLSIDNFRCHHQPIWYGNIYELKILMKELHEFGIRVLGDVVLNHRCAEYKNQNGIWNIFCGHLNWDDHAVVSDRTIIHW